MSRIVEDALLVYTDGSLYPKGRKGGYGVVFIHVDAVGNEVIIHEHAPPGARGVTNNRMELQACIDAVKLAPDIECFGSINRVVVRTDSLYVKDNYLNALGRWRMAGWRDGNGKPVANADLWKEFVRAHGRLRKRFEIQKVKAHGKGAAKDLNNYRADRLAKESATKSASAVEVPHFGTAKVCAWNHSSRKRAAGWATSHRLHHRGAALARSEDVEVPLSGPLFG